MQVIHYVHSVGVQKAPEWQNVQYKSSIHCVCVCVYRCIMCTNVPPEINVIFIRTCQIHKQTIFECTFILAQNEVVSYFDLAAQWIMKPSVSEGALSMISSPTRVISAPGVKG